ncbi:hypothetical protein EUGRSUZ_F02680 [Eucalyptus grandis]|uniref:Uncharacterized protein n=2 Tax=Eucalyptus grandis TaxID=71139 RepID=A0ACC3KKD8_EUCGR|nr:hypothetical protein EUGRSUZ_F02680 [Eucalyptus grandis]
MLNRVEFHFYLVGLNNLVHTFSNELFFLFGQSNNHAASGLKSSKSINSEQLLSSYQCNLSSQPSGRRFISLTLSCNSPAILTSSAPRDLCLLDIQLED